MSSLEPTLIEKACTDFGCEYTVSEMPFSETLGAARYSLQAEVKNVAADCLLRLIDARHLLIRELTLH